ncbi:MAG: hypothetical protein SFW36_23445 [Leptolyngbyaceae cyanobacterium bins.59]|nr:hypothetical protein [Leptolyngbyaceae cyanobacterium bins.59]
MTQADLEALLIAAFTQCEIEGCALTAQQKQIFFNLIKDLTASAPIATAIDTDTGNPLDDLTPEQRQALLAFVRAEDHPDRSWKIKLLDDWVQGRSSGRVQFIRDFYGIPWLERVKPSHLAAYTEEEDPILRLKVGDRIEVCNGLWEWVQETGPCSQEWFLCTVVGLQTVSDDRVVSCTIRFENGSEYEIQGIYDWNRYQWRWPQET